MTQESRKPDWRKWPQMPYWKLWEAVALSLDIEPNKVKLNKYAWMGAEHPFAESLTDQDHAFTESLTFNDRLEILRRNVGGANGLTANRGAHWYEATVNTREFAAWAIQSEWDVPPELEEIARGPSGAATSQLKPKPKQATGEIVPDKPQGWRRRDILAAIRKLGHSPTELPPRPKDSRNWVKAEVWRELGWPKTDRDAFDSQWDAMRRASHIAERQSQDPPS